MHFGLKNNRFWVEFDSCTSPVGNLREESEKQARFLYNENPNLLLGLSSGLDSQIVLHSFYSQGMRIPCAFLHMPGYNDVEYNQLTLLEQKYDFKCQVVSIDPIACRGEILAEAFETKIHANQLLQKKFLKALPTDCNFIQGIEGPNIIKSNNKFYFFESYNSFEKLRLRAFDSLNRTGKVISWERSPEMMCSILTDTVFKAFLSSYEYSARHNVVYSNSSVIDFKDRWDVFVKHIMYGQYWNDELLYFPKYQGPENIDYVMNSPKPDYMSQCSYIRYDGLVKHLTTANGRKLTAWENTEPGHGDFL